MGVALVDGALVLLADVDDVKGVSEEVVLNVEDGEVSVLREMVDDNEVGTPVERLLVAVPVKAVLSSQSVLELDESEE